MKSILHKKQTKFFISILEINPRRCQWIDNPKWIINLGKQKMQMTALQMLLYMKEMLYAVRCLKSNEDMILALAGQFKQLSHEPEKFR